jgi:hypothetical protein
VLRLSPRIPSTQVGFLEFRLQKNSLLMIEIPVAFQPDGRIHVVLDIHQVFDMPRYSVTVFAGGEPTPERGRNILLREGRAPSGAR